MEHKSENDVNLRNLYKYLDEVKRTVNRTKCIRISILSLFTFIGLISVVPFIIISINENEEEWLYAPYVGVILMASINLLSTFMVKINDLILWEKNLYTNLCKFNNGIKTRSLLIKATRQNNFPEDFVRNEDYIDKNTEYIQIHCDKAIPDWHITIGLYEEPKLGSNYRPMTDDINSRQQLADKLKNNIEDYLYGKVKEVSNEYFRKVHCNTTEIRSRNVTVLEFIRYFILLNDYHVSSSPEINTEFITCCLCKCRFFIPKL